MAHRPMLDLDGQARLKKVLEIACGDIQSVERAVEVALGGVFEKARRCYLRNELKRRARRRLRDVERQENKEEKATYSAGTYLSAYQHERRLMQGIPEDDL